MKWKYSNLSRHSCEVYEIMDVDPQVMTVISKSSQRADAALTFWLWSFLSLSPSLSLVFLYLIFFSSSKTSVLGDLHLNSLSSHLLHRHMLGCINRKQFYFSLPLFLSLLLPPLSLFPVLFTFITGLSQTQDREDSN